MGLAKVVGKYYPTLMLSPLLYSVIDWLFYVADCTILFVCIRFDVMKIVGKQNRQVPLLIKKEWIPAMQLLVDRRDECQVLEENEFFFATPKKLTHLNAWQVGYFRRIQIVCLAYLPA